MLLRCICEVCCKAQVLTPEQAFKKGWDYPPTFGEFTEIFPRTCGSGTCGINGTLWWALNMEGKQLADLNAKQLETLHRILREPGSIAP